MQLFLIKYSLIRSMSLTAKKIIVNITILVAVLVSGVLMIVIKDTTSKTCTPTHNEINITIE